jgi:hypothetical protein
VIIPPRKKIHTQTYPPYEESKREQNTTETLHHVLKKHHCGPPVLIFPGKPNSERHPQLFLIIQNIFKTPRKHPGEELEIQLQDPTKRNEDPLEKYYSHPRRT